MGWTFNTANPDAPTDGPQIVAVAVIMTTLALTTVILRVYVRCVMLNAFGTGKQPLISDHLPPTFLIALAYDGDPNECLTNCYTCR